MAAVCSLLLSFHFECEMCDTISLNKRFERVCSSFHFTGTNEKLWKSAEWNLAQFYEQWWIQRRKAASLCYCCCCDSQLVMCQCRICVQLIVLFLVSANYFVTIWFHWVRVGHWRYERIVCGQFTRHPLIQLKIWTKREKKITRND